MSQEAVSVERILPEAFHALEGHSKAMHAMLFGVPGVSYAAGAHARSAEFPVKPLVFSPQVTMEAHKAHASLKALLLTLVPDASLELTQRQMQFAGAAVGPYAHLHGAFYDLVEAIKASTAGESTEGQNETQLMAEVGKFAGTLDAYFPMPKDEAAAATAVVDEPVEEEKPDRKPVVAVPAIALQQRRAAAGYRSSRGSGADTYWRARAAAIAAALLLMLITPDRLTNGGHGGYTGGRGFVTADVAPEIVTKRAICPDDQDAPCGVTESLPDKIVVAELPLPYEHLFDFDPGALQLKAPEPDTVHAQFCCLAANAGCIRSLEMFKEVVAATAAHVGQIKDGKMWLGRLNDQTLSEEGLATALKEVSHFFFYTAKTSDPEMALKAITLATILVPNEPVFAMRAAKVMEQAGDMYVRRGYGAHALDFIERALELMERVPNSADKRSLYKRLYSMAAMTDVVDAGTNEPDERAVVRGEFACGIRPLVP